MTVKDLALKAKRAASTRRGRNILTFLVFIVIATFFWLLLVLNDTFQRDYRVKVEVAGMPDDVTVLQPLPQFVDVVVRGKGSDLVKREYFSEPKVKLSYSDFYIYNDGRMVLPEQRLSSLVRDAFGSGAQLMSMRPDSISVRYTTLPPERLQLRVNVDARAKLYHTISGDIKADVDSVLVYSESGLDSNVAYLKTKYLSLRNLSDTAVVDIAVEGPEGCRVEPPIVRVTIPVEPLVPRTRHVKVTPRNVPHNSTMQTFPAMVEVTYYAPRSSNDDTDALPTVIADYEDRSADSNTLPLKVIQAPGQEYNVKLKQQEVEYLIERRYFFR